MQASWSSGVLGPASQQPIYELVVYHIVSITCACSGVSWWLCSVRLMIGTWSIMTTRKKKSVAWYLVHTHCILTHSNSYLLDNSHKEFASVSLLCHVVEEQLHNLQQGMKPHMHLHPHTADMYLLRLRISWPELWVCTHIKPAVA